MTPSDDGLDENGKPRPAMARLAMPSDAYLLRGTAINLRKLADACERLGGDAEKQPDWWFSNRREEVEAAKGWFAKIRFVLDEMLDRIARTAPERSGDELPPPPAGSQGVDVDEERAKKATKDDEAFQQKTKLRIQSVLDLGGES